MVPAFTLVASLTLTVKDVHRFSVGLELGCDLDDPGEQKLQMSDFRYSDTRSLCKMAVIEFLLKFLPRKCIKDHQISIASPATVLFQLYKDREATWESCKEGNDHLTLTPLDEAKTLHSSSMLLSREPCLT